MTADARTKLADALAASLTTRLRVYGMSGSRVAVACEVMAEDLLTSVPELFAQTQEKAA